MKTMMLADFLALAKSLRKWALLYVLLAFGMCLVFGGTPALILFISFPFAHTVLAPMLMRDQDRAGTPFGKRYRFRVPTWWRGATPASLSSLPLACRSVRPSI